MKRRRNRWSCLSGMWCRRFGNPLLARPGKLKRPGRVRGVLVLRRLVVPKIASGCVLAISENGAPTKTSVEHFKINDLVQAFANFTQGNQTIGIVGVLTTRPGDRTSFQFLTTPARYDPG